MQTFKKRKTLFKKRKLFKEKEKSACQSNPCRKNSTFLCEDSVKKISQFFCKDAQGCSDMQDLQGVNHEKSENDEEKFYFCAV